jgi:hypothetical protein
MPLRTSTVRDPARWPSAMSISRSSPITASSCVGRPRRELISATAAREGLLGLAVVFVLGGLKRAERLVPVGFEAVGNEPVVGIDGEIAATGELGVLVGALDVGPAELVGFIGAGFEFGLDGQRDLERERGDGLQQQLFDRLIDGVAWKLLADRSGALDVVVGAAIVGHERVAALVIADGHASSAASADHESLQQRWAFAGGSGGAVGAVRIGVCCQQLLVVLELFPGQIAGVRVVDQAGPLLAWELSGGGAPVRSLARPALSIDERAGIAGVVQGAKDPPVRQLVPCQLAFAWPFADPAGEPQPVAVKRIDNCARGAGPGERGEQVTQCVLDRAVGVEHDLPGGVGHQPDRERHRQLTAAGFGQDAALQPGADEVQLSLRHRAFSPSSSRSLKSAGS